MQAIGHVKADGVKKVVEQQRNEAAKKLEMLTAVKRAQRQIMVFLFFFALHSVSILLQNTLVIFCLCNKIERSNSSTYRLPNYLSTFAPGVLRVENISQLI